MAIVNRRMTGPLTDVQIITENADGNFLTATGRSNEVEGLTPAQASALLGGGTVGSLSLRSANGDYYSVGVTNGGILTAISQSNASNSVVLKATDGTCFALAVSNGGILTLTSGSC